MTGMGKQDTTFSRFLPAMYGNPFVECAAKIIFARIEENDTLGCSQPGQSQTW